MRPTLKVLLNGTRLINSNFSLDQLKSQLLKATQTKQDQKPTPTPTLTPTPKSTTKQASYISLTPSRKQRCARSSNLFNQETRIKVSKAPKAPNNDHDYFSKNSVNSSKPINWTSQHWRDDNPIKARTTLQAKTEFDSIIQDWITRDWLNDDRIEIQHKPIHFLVHDKLIYESFSIVDGLISVIRSRYPGVNFGDSINEIRSRWHKALSEIEFADTSLNHYTTNLKLKEIIKDILFPTCKRIPEIKQFLNKDLPKGKILTELEEATQSNLTINEDTLEVLKNLANLSTDNFFSCVRDKELSFLESVESKYLRMFKSYRSKYFTNAGGIGVVKYQFNFGNKLRDEVNIEKIRFAVNFEGKLRSRFLLLTNDKDTSLEYYRILKVLNAELKHLDRKGCVVYLNSNNGNENDDSKIYGDNDYYVINKLKDIYEVIEKL